MLGAEPNSISRKCWPRVASCLADWTIAARQGAGTLSRRRCIAVLGKPSSPINWMACGYLLSQGFVDPARVGIYGWSYGGFMTLYSLLNAPDVFRAGIAGAPVTNWRNYDTIYTERYLGLPSENPEGYRASSPVDYAAKLKAKLLIVHNIEDDNVLFQNTVQMTDALEQAGKLFDMVIYTEKSHGVTGPARRQLLETLTDFFEKNLK